jgi:hypothetical protein
MSEFAFQQAFVRLLTDTPARQSFLAGDAQALAQSGFSPELISRLFAIDKERFEIYADMVLAQRVNDVAEALPLTSQVLGDQLPSLVHDFFEHTAADFPKRHQGPLAFGGVLLERFCSQAPTPLFIQDVIKYEVTVLEMYDEFVEQDDVAPEIDNAANDISYLDGTPIRMPNVRVISFDHDIVQIIKALKENQIPAPLPQAVHLIVQLKSTGAIQQLKANLPTVDFFTACDGKTTLADIAANLFAKYHQEAELFPKFKDTCVELCRGLSDHGLIYLRASC